MHDLKLFKINGDYYMDSYDVADAIGKRHDHLLRDIPGYRKTLAKADLPKLGGINFFVESIYTDERGRVMLCYLLSKAGCDVCANNSIPLPLMSCFFIRSRPRRDKPRKNPSLKDKLNGAKGKAARNSDNNPPGHEPTKRDGAGLE